MRIALLACCTVAIACAGADAVRLAPMGRINVEAADVQLVPTVYYPRWVSRTPVGGYRPEPDGSRRWRIKERYSGADGENPTYFTGRTLVTRLDGRSLRIEMDFEVVATNVHLLAGSLSFRLPCSRYAGGRVLWDGGRSCALPATRDAKRSFCVLRERVKGISFRDAQNAETFALEFPSASQCFLQDNREWGADNFSLRLYLDGMGGKNLPKGRKYGLSLVLRLPRDVEFTAAEHVIREGDGWVRLAAKNDMLPGGVLDFSRMGFHDAPAGKYGWLVSKGGHFEFEGRPGVRQRFYGVNFVGAANYPPAEMAEAYVANLARIGYNAVRFHHHDNGLSGGKDGTLDPATMERFDAVVAACIRHGIYMTTDLYVSRRVPYRDMGIDKPGAARPREFKDLVETHEGAFQNFIRYSRAFLEHVNPHTGRRYADEPAMPLYSLVNEGDHRGVLTVENERTFARRVTRWLRDEVKSRVLLTNMNNYAYPEEYDEVRANEYDYIDGHFYCDHPSFLENRWQLPSSLPNVNPLTREKHGIYWPLSYRRRIAKAMPFVITEYNYSGPGAYRSLGGIETGAIAAQEDLDGLWRFAWSHGIEGVRGPKAMTYFDMSGDPLSLAGERASLCLFLRGDLEAGDRSAISEDRATGSLRIVTGRTCGGFSERGPVDAGPLHADLDSAATVWASSLDGLPLARSRHMLFCHLTDVQNSGITYADSMRRVLLKWGSLPHLARRGAADVRLATGVRGWSVHALDCSGARRAQIGCREEGGALSFRADVARDPSDATMLYELVAP